jgi:dolichol kinase
MLLLLVTALLFIWNLLVIHVISKFFYNFFTTYENIPAEYVGRKIVHILGGGLTAVLIPYFYEGYYWIITASAFILAIYIYLRRRIGRLYWFQVKENSYEVHFALSYGAVLLLGVFLGDVWIGLIPILFMSFGDSATGLVRAFTQKRQVKSWDGTIAMFITCSIIGVSKLGLFGLFLSLIISLVEKIPKLDDNITVPIVSATLMYLQSIF